MSSTSSHAPALRASLCEALPWGNLPWSDTPGTFSTSILLHFFCCSSYRSWWCLCFIHLMPVLGNTVFESRSMFYYLWPTVPGLVPETWWILNQCLFNQWMSMQMNRSSVGTGQGWTDPSVSPKWVDTNLHLLSGGKLPSDFPAHVFIHSLIHSFFKLFCLLVSPS